MSDTKTDLSDIEDSQVTEPVERPDETSPEGQGDEQSAPDGDSPSLEDWKRHARTWEDRSKQHKADSEAKDARIATLEKALEDGTDATEALSTSRAQAARYRAALDAGMDAATADAVLTATDPEQIEAQAKAFTEAVTAQVEKKTDHMAERQVKSNIRENPLQGSPATPKADPEALFERLSKR